MLNVFPRLTDLALCVASANTRLTSASYVSLSIRTGLGGSSDFFANSITSLFLIENERFK